MDLKQQAADINAGLLRRRVLDLLMYRDDPIA
jgi:hypothetical protein